MSLSTAPSCRVGLAVLAASGLYVGIWALLGPRSFYRSFPGLGHHWTVTTGPYNEHFITDVGAAYLAFTIAAVLALVWGDVRSTRLAGAVWAVFSAPHLVFHARHLMGLSTFDKVAELATLGGTLVIAVWLALPQRAVPRDG